MDHNPSRYVTGIWKKGQVVTMSLSQAIAGYPIVTGERFFPRQVPVDAHISPVPLDFYPNNVKIGSAGPVTVYPAPGVPFGLSFLGTAFSEFDLIGFAYAYEQKTKTRLARKAMPNAIPKIQLKDIVDKP